MTHPTPSDVTHQALQKARDAAILTQTTLDNLPEGV